MELEDNPVKSVESHQGALRMFRVWHVKMEGNQPRLGAITTDHLWRPGVNVSHDVPKLGGYGAGFYGFNQYKHMGNQEKFGVKGAENIIGGSFIGFGHCVIAEEGARVQKAVVESIIEPPGMSENYVTVLFQLAEYYGCHYITDEQAKDLKTGLVEYREGMKL